MYEYLDRRYAEALYEVAEEKGKVDEYLEDLRIIVDMFKNDENFIKVIKHPRISTSRKRELFTTIFKDKIDDELLSFLLILINKGRILYLEEKLKEMEKIHLERHNTLIAEVKTAVPLTEEEKNKLVEKLEKKYDKKVLLDDSIEKKLIGGVYVRVGDDVIDGTIKHKLEELKKRILD
ncbi:F0F1 ATP synthase subunit delta [Hathewaya limosa]|uniref:ATP synthase subunit delta n=1 Tax=Hathewaya limosa TaxID=1536 RepID=A0ABU0JMV5_HATLI|nr:F0F1 ATP synthase subunit delta [Hathewaya limosa]AWZ49305.1 F0F1 ATP synthase subunit delta [Clostridiaceae bacterium 14S0207]MDQ0478401.1 F-type H+-transporting ATPase subunit delta [Hathewaya limosa]